MRKIVELVKYQRQIYFGGSRFVMPLIAAVAFLFVMYSMKPLKIVDSYSLSCYFVFFVMVWIGFGLSADENPVMEQILQLRTRSGFCYYFSKIVFACMLGVILSAMCAVFPVLQNVLNQFMLFSRPLTGYDVLNAAVLLSGYAFAGGALGSLLHPRVMKDRKLAVILTALLTLLTLTRTAWVREVPVLKWIAWIFPPVHRISVVYGQSDSFRFLSSAWIFASMLAYGIVLGMIKSVLCHRNKF